MDDTHKLATFYQLSLEDVYYPLAVTAYLVKRTVDEVSSVLVDVAKHHSHHNLSIRKGDTIFTVKPDEGKDFTEEEEYSFTELGGKYRNITQDFIFPVAQYGSVMAYMAFSKIYSTSFLNEAPSELWSEEGCKTIGNAMWMSEFKLNINKRMQRFNVSGFIDSKKIVKLIYDSRPNFLCQEGILGRYTVLVKYFASRERVLSIQIKATFAKFFEKRSAIGDYQHVEFHIGGSRIVWIEGSKIYRGKALKSYQDQLTKEEVLTFDVTHDGIAVYITRFGRST